MTDVSAKPQAAAASAPKATRRETREVDFKFLRSELESVRSITGESLLSHLKRVFAHLIQHSPELAMERFEEVSLMIK